MGCPKKKQSSNRRGVECDCLECSKESQKFSSQEYTKPPAPPPYGREDLWELQFCRWWGWNWVKKREEETHPPKGVKATRGATATSRSYHNQQGCAKPPPKEYQNQQGCIKPPPKEWGSEHQQNHHRRRQPHHRRRHQQQQPNKSRVRNFCECFFKKKSPERRPHPEMQKLYDTPSNSVILCETYACGVLDQSNDTFEEINVSRSVSKQNRREVRRQKETSCQSWVTESNASSGEDVEIEIYCNGMTKNREMTSEENTEYINTRMEGLKEPPPVERSEIEFKDTGVQANLYVEEMRRTNNATQTRQYKEAAVVRKYASSEHYNDGEVGKECPPCQQYSTSKKYKARKIRVTCCCCSDPDNNQKKNSTGMSQNDRANQKDRNSLDKEDTMEDVTQQSLTAYAALNPHSFFLPSKKHFSKFGKPSQNYPWLHTTLSENITSKSWISEEFRSPISGKLYNVQPLKLNNVHAEKEIDLPELIDISENLNYLKRIESFTKTDFEKRIMMDALCDAILCGDEKDFRTSSSTFMNRFGYDINRQDSSSSSYGVNGNTFRSNKGKHKTFINSDFGQQFSCHSKFQENYWLNEELSKEKRDAFTDDDFARTRWIPEKSCDISNDFDSIIKENMSRKNLKSDLEGSYSICTPEPIEMPAFTKTGLLSSVSVKCNKPIKRSRSPNVEWTTNKKVKQQHSSTSGSETNLDTIFEKINELVEKSKVTNNEMVQNLLDATVPKRTYRISPLIQTQNNTEATRQMIRDDAKSNASHKSTSPSQTRDITEKILTKTSFTVCDTKSTAGEEIRDAEINDVKTSQPQTTSRLSLIPVRKMNSVKSRPSRHKK